MKVYEKVNKIVGVFREFPQKLPTPLVPDGPMIGNGDIGVVAGGKKDTLEFWLGKNDLWNAVFSHEEGAAGVKGVGILRLCAPVLQKGVFYAEQHIGTADIMVRLSTEKFSLRVDAYAPYQQHFVVLKILAEKGNIPLSIYFSPLADHMADYSQHTEGNTIRITKSYVRNVVFESQAAGVCRVMEWDKTHEVLQEGQKITLIVPVWTNLDLESLGEDGCWMERALQDAAAVTEQSLVDTRKAHLEWWEAFWNTSGIDIPAEPEIEKFWYGSHYLMACCCKEGAHAPGLFGNWITTNAAGWSGDYHLNYNYQAPWWGVYSSNKVDLSLPYDQPIMDYLPAARENARKFLGCRGIYSRVGIGPKGYEASRSFNLDGTENETLSFWGQKSNASYVAINMIMRFYSTWDREYAEKIVFPYLCEVADFWEDYLKFEDGRYISYNDCAHENSMEAAGIFDWPWLDKCADWSDDCNPVTSLGFIRKIFACLLDLSEFLGQKAEKREKWQHILDHISPFPTQEKDGKTVFRYTESGLGWWFEGTVGMNHIYPAGCIGLGSDEKLLQIARNTVETLNRWVDYNAFCTYYTGAVRVGYDPATVLDKFKEQFMTHSFPNFFIFYGGGGIECCSAVPGCVNEMLFQSHEGLLRFFPVWEKDKDASFTKLRGYGAFVVSASQKNSVVCDVQIISEQGRPCAVLCPWDGGMRVLENGNAVECTTEECRDGVIYRFETIPGAEYRIEPV